MSRIGIIKKLLAFSLALTTAFTVVAGGRVNLIEDENVVATSSEAKENAEAIEQAEKDIEDLKSQQKDLDAKIEAAQKDIATEKEAQTHINEQISVVEKTIQKYDEKIQEYNKEIKALKKDIEAREESIAQKQEEIEQGIEDFKQRIRVLYVTGTDSYTDILIGAKDFYDMLMRIELVKRVAEYDNNMIDSLIELKEQYEAEKEALEASKLDLEDKKKVQEEEKAKQEEQKDKLDELYKQSEVAIANLKKAEQAYKNNQEALKADQEDFEADLQKLYQEREAIKEKEQQQQQQQNRPGGITNNTQQGSTDNADHGYVDTSMFTWPVPGYYHITYGVGWRWGAYHQGIDISSSGIRGAKICASAAGTVIRVVNGCGHDYGKNGSCGCGGGYGNHCIIDHGNGYWTLYAHSEYITVSMGQYVNQGDVLGTVGSTGFSTGPHLHFEIRLNGVAQNPELYV